jgi:GR25 family glycosyltransferase involved in LPS biosynthesis
MTTSLKSIQDIDHLYYINLDHRTDRKSHVEEQLKKIGIRTESVQRFSAIKPANGNGAIGCTMSHLRCLQQAKEAGWDHVCIVEDDIEFLDPQLFLKQMNQFLENHPIWDVVLIGGNNVPPYQKIDTTCVRVQSCQTTTGYLVKSHYFDTLIKNIKEGLGLLIRNPEKHVLYAIDKYWFQLQREDHWYLIIPLTVTQRADYSDIEKRPTNYQRVMTDLDKLYLYR